MDEVQTEQYREKRVSQSLSQSLIGSLMRYDWKVEVFFFSEIKYVIRVIEKREVDFHFQTRSHSLLWTFIVTL